MSPLNITQTLGIWSIMATIRWCPIYPKWDSYQPQWILCKNQLCASCLSISNKGVHRSSMGSTVPLPPALWLDARGFLWPSRKIQMSEFSGASCQSCFRYSKTPSVVWFQFAQTSQFWLFIQSNVIGSSRPTATFYNTHYIFFSGMSM
jgi:hypothetical protein